MKVTQEKLPDSQIGLEIEISGESSRNTYEKVVQNLARSSHVPGFRKGKVPRQVLMQRIGSQKIKAAALEELIQTSLSEAIKQESIESLGNYRLRSNFDELIAQYKPGEPLTFSAAVDVPPTPELGDYQNLSVKAEEVVYNPEEIENFLAEKRTQNADLIPVEDRQAEMEDIAIVDFQGKLQTEEGEQDIEGGSATNFQVELAEGKLIEGMVEGIVGMQPGETKEVSVTFPEDYPQEELAGKPAVFSITLQELKTKDLPELDDEFAEEASEFETMAQWRESLEQQFKERAEQETKKNINAAIVEALVEQASVEIPDTMVQEEVTNLLTQTLVQMQQMGVDVKQLFTSENVPKMRENARPEANANLKKSLVISEIAKQESLLPNEEAIASKMKEIEQQLSGQDIDRDKLRRMVENDLTEANTLDWLREKVKVELVPQGSLAEAAESEAETEAAEAEPEEQSEN